MYHRPKFDLGTALVVICVLFGLLVSGTLLGSCTTAHTLPRYSDKVGVHEYSHDSRTKHAEPRPSHIR